MQSKRLVVDAPGAPLKLIQDTCPDPKPDAVQVRILTAGVSYADVSIRYGVYPAAIPYPLTPGYEIVGRVEKVGADVQHVQVGQMVAALTVINGYREIINLPAHALLPIPAGFDPVKVVSLLLNYVTAYQLLHRVAQVQPGQRVLIHSAAGGVGTALLQLGRLAGVEMYGTASAGKHALVRDLGATPIDYKAVDFVEVIQAMGGVDVALDAIGGAHLARSYQALRPSGLLVVYGLLAALEQGTPHPELVERYMEDMTAIQQNGDPRRVLDYSVSMLKHDHPDWYAEDLAILLALLADGKINPIIDQCFPMEQGQQAHERFERGQHVGKIVLVM